MAFLNGMSCICVPTTFCRRSQFYVFYNTATRVAHCPSDVWLLSHINAWGRKMICELCCITVHHTVLWDNRSTGQL